MVDDTMALMKEDMDNQIKTQMEKDTNTASLAQVTHAAQATINQKYGGKDGKGNANDMVNRYLRRRGSYLRCCIS